MLHIILGQGLDGGVCPDVLDGHSASAGTLRLGPAKFLHRLELVLGLPSRSVREPLRVARFVRCLGELDAESDGTLFYSRSRETDPWRTARKLLSLRDELIFAGWEARTATTGLAPRLEVFAAIEKRLSTTLGKDAPSGIPDRLLRVLDRLDRLPSGISRLELVEDATTFPRLWQRVFERLREKGTEVGSPAPETGSIQASVQESDLARAKVALDPTATPGGAVTGDGSFLRLEAKSLAEAAEATAALIRRVVETEDPRGVVLVRDGEPKTHLFLDAALRRQGVALPGLASTSAYRPMSQVLPLLLGLAWEPVDPDLLVQFLSLSESPLPSLLRRRLLKALNSVPGYGSRVWDGAVEEAIETLRNRSGDEAAEDAAAALAEWIGDVERVPADRELSIRQAGDLAAKVERWAHRKMHASEGDLVSVAVFEQARVLGAMLDHHPRETVSRPELRRMVQDVLDLGIRCDLGEREAGAIQVVSDPAAIIGEVGTVIWWQCVGASARVPGPSFWTEGEAAAVAGGGGELPDPTRVLLSRSVGWSRPVRMARDRVVLVQPEQVFSEAQESHPLWNEITLRIAREESDRYRMSVDAMELLREKGRITARVEETVAVGPPRARGVWSVNPTLVGPRDEESPSSLEALLACPLRWTFKHKAKLREPRIPVLPEGNLFYGNLAHELFSAYFDDLEGGELPDPDTAAAEIERRFQETVGRDAAPLVRCGMEREKRFVQEKLVAAMRELVERLHAAGYGVAATEQTHKGMIGDTSLQGRLDLLLKRKRDGRSAVLDLKWSGKTRKREALERGRALQLAAYSHLVRGEGDGWPPTGFFLIPSAGLQTTHRDEFPGCASVQGPDEEEVWRSACRSYEAVRADLEAGVVKAPFIDDEERRRPSGFGEGGIRLEAPCRFCAYRTFCGARKGS